MTNFTAAEISERELEIRKLLETTPLVFSYGYGFDPHDPHTILEEKPETHFEEMLSRCVRKDPHRPPVYLIGKLETHIDGASGPQSFNVLFLPDLLTGSTEDVLKLIRASLYERALSFLVEQSLIKDPPPLSRGARHRP